MMRGLLVLGFLILGSCFSMSKEECDQSNWYNHGYNDGSIGKPYAEKGWFPAEVKACEAYGNLDQKKADYARGVQMGLKDYCAHKSVCPEAKKLE